MRILRLNPALQLFTIICIFVAFSAFTCTAADVKRQSLTKANQVEIGLGTAFDTVENLRVNGLVPVDKEKLSIQGIRKANKAVLAFNKRAEGINPGNISESDRADLIKAWAEVLSALKDPDILAVGGIKSPATQQTVNAVVTSLITTAEGLMDTLQRIRPRPPAAQ